MKNNYYLFKNVFDINFTMNLLKWKNGSNLIFLNQNVIFYNYQYIQMQVGCRFSINSRNSGENIEEVLIERVNILESQYALMESQYLKKIKDLKASLKQKVKKQHSLHLQINNLREECRSHQQQIKKIVSQLNSTQNIQKNANKSPKNHKKSVQGVKLQINKSNSNTALNSSGANNVSNSFGSSQQINIISSGNLNPPSNNFGTLPNSNYLKKSDKSDYLKEVRHKLVLQQQKYKIKVTQTQATSKSPKQTKPSSHSPKQGSQRKYLRGFLLNSMKKQINQKIALPVNPTRNASPKRIIRYSPTTKNQPQKPQERKILGRIKQSLQSF